MIQYYYGSRRILKCSIDNAQIRLYKIINVGMDENKNKYSSVIGEMIKVLQGGMMFSKVAAFL